MSSKDPSAHKMSELGEQLQLLELECPPPDNTILEAVSWGCSEGGHSWLDIVNREHTCVTDDKSLNLSSSHFLGARKFISRLPQASKGEESYL